MTDTNTTFAIYALGDSDTVARTRMLEAKAAEHGAVVRKMFAFAPGEAAGADDLSGVDGVVEALAGAISDRIDLWVPLWLQDLVREQHLRSVSITLHRHGRRLLLGPLLAPCPADGGLNQLDAALRSEIRAVDALDSAVMAATALDSLTAEIEATLYGRSLRDESKLRLGCVEPTYSTAEIAALLGKSPQWVSRGVRGETFAYRDGSVVEPLARPTGRAFTATMIRAIAWSAYRRGTLSEDRLEEVLAELVRSEG